MVVPGDCQWIVVLELETAEAAVVLKSVHAEPCHGGGIDRPRTGAETAGTMPSIEEIRVVRLEARNDVLIRERHLSLRTGTPRTTKVCVHRDLVALVGDPLQTIPDVSSFLLRAPRRDKRGC